MQFPFVAAEFVTVYHRWAAALHMLSPTQLAAQPAPTSKPPTDTNTEPPKPPYLWVSTSGVSDSL